MNVKHEYRVRPVVRYIITDFESHESEDGHYGACGSRIVAECPNEETAYRVCDELQKASDAQQAVVLSPPLSAGTA